MFYKKFQNWDNIYISINILTKDLLESMMIDRIVYALYINSKKHCTQNNINAAK